MPTIGTFEIGREGIPSTYLRDPPTVTITSPGSVVTSNNATVTWTYSSALSKAQEFFTVTLLNANETTVLHSSGIVAGAGTSYMIPFQLSPFTSYVVRVAANDGDDSGSDDRTFFVDIAGVPDIDDNTQVGSVYEIAINGVGYMLADHPETGTRYRAQSVQLDPERFATGSTPFSESVERYSFVGHSDWRAGEGQLYLNRAASNPSRYFYSEGINPFEPGQLTCLTQPTRHITSSYAVQRAVTTGLFSNVYVQTGDNQLTFRDTPGGSNTPFTPMASGTIGDLASDGDNWYATNGSAIRRNTTAAAPAGDWSTVAVTEIEWVGDRLAGLDTAASDPNFTTFDDAGAEEVASGREAFPDSELLGITGGDGFVWFGVNRGGVGTVRGWQLDSADTSIIALTLPAGETVGGLFFYLGNVFVVGISADRLVNKIYRCIPSEGRLTPELIAEVGWVLFDRITFAGVDRFVGFSWPSMQRDGKPGIGVVDLESSGVARWYAPAGATATNNTQSVVRFAGDFAFTVAEDGFYGEASTVAYRAGFLETSIADLESAIPKVLDSITVQTKPLLNDSSVAVAYSVDSNESFVAVDTMAGAGVQQAEFDIEGVTGGSIGVKLTLTPDPVTVTPTVKMVVLKTHPMSLTDELVQVAINCADRLNGLNGKELPESAPGAGVRRARDLRQICGQNVKFQDIDWPLTGQSELFQMVSTDMTSTGVFDRHLNRRSDHAVVQVTLRRPS